MNQFGKTTSYLAALVCLMDYQAYCKRSQLEVTLTEMGWLHRWGMQFNLFLPGAERTEGYLSSTHAVDSTEPVGTENTPGEYSVYLERFQCLVEQPTVPLSPPIPSWAPSPMHSSELELAQCRKLVLSTTRANVKLQHPQEKLVNYHNFATLHLHNKLRSSCGDYAFSTQCVQHAGVSTPNPSLIDWCF